MLHKELTTGWHFKHNVLEVYVISDLVPKNTLPDNPSNLLQFAREFLFAPFIDALREVHCTAL